MIESINSKICKLIVHQMGAKQDGGELRLARRELNIDPEEDPIADLLRLFFFKSFKTESYYTFWHEEAIEKNIIYSLASDYFSGKQDFYSTSAQIAQHLFDNSNHPKIKGGEIYISHFTDVCIDGEICDAIGIFKSENKETYLKVNFKADQEIELQQQDGISIRKIDKGCIIFNIEQGEGYRVCAVDNINRGQEALFWMQNFLGVRPREDNYYYTDNFMQMCKGFVTDVYNPQNQTSKPDQMDFMNRTVNYFENSTQFNEADFNKSVMQMQPDVIDAFNNYKQEYEQRQGYYEPLPMDFGISRDAVKGEKKYFKSILKLDKNFHIYVHGGRELIEKGYDEEKQRNYYKLYYYNEQ